MQLEGHKTIPSTPDRVYGLLTDPEVLVRTMPGLKRMTPTGDGRYDAEMEMGVAAIRGRYEGWMTIEDAVLGQSYRLRMEGQGPGGFVAVDMAVTLSPTDEGTDLRYVGQAKVGGTVAGVGQRMLSGVASFIMGQFFGAVAKEARQQP
ncbi:MAG: carbon monoxide dehydrogenase subunit G [Thermaerobacter sp.]|nr:carbon monoxide dehydrogenase subunit G [Thermaerobacter sp.]